MRIVFFLVFFISGVMASAQADTTSYAVFSAEEWRIDLDSMYRQLQENHPDLYASWDKASADAAFLEARKKIAHPMNRIEFTRMISPLVSRFRDGHTFISVEFESEEFKRYDEGGGRIFPLGVTIINGRLYCTNTRFFPGILNQGDEIKSINGKPAIEIVRKLSSFWPGDDLRSSTIIAQRLFGFSLWMVYGWGTNTRIEFEQDGKIKSSVLPGISRQEYKDLIFNISGIRVLHLYPEYSLAVIEINEYSSMKRSQTFIDSCFRVIQGEGIKNVALDLRKNGGGNSSIGAYLLAHITKKSFGTVRSKTWRLGPIMKAVDSTNWRYPALLEFIRKGTLEGSDRYRMEYALEAPDSLLYPELFSGVNFYLFTSGRTYSSAHMTALSVKCGGLGTIIGQSTGERLDLTGEIAPFKLPNSKLEIWVPTATYQSACGNGKQVGVEPDYFVPLRIEDIRAGRDAELDFLKELIRKGN